MAHQSEDTSDEPADWAIVFVHGIGLLNPGSTLQDSLDHPSKT
jgi:hypothetical protein